MSDRPVGNRVTIRVRVTIDLVIDGRLVTADRWILLGDKHPLVDPSEEMLLNAAHYKAMEATVDAVAELKARLV